MGRHEPNDDEIRSKIKRVKSLEMKRERRRLEGERMHKHLFGSNNITQEEFSSYQIIPARLNLSEIPSSSERGADGLDEFLALPEIQSMRILL